MFLVKFYIFEENLGTYPLMKMTVRYYGHHSRSKSLRFGHYVECEDAVITLIVVTQPILTRLLTLIYCLIPNYIMLKMISAMENPLSHTVFFDTLFTDYPLPSKLQNTNNLYFI